MNWSVFPYNFLVGSGKEGALSSLEVIKDVVIQDVSLAEPASQKKWRQHKRDLKDWSSWFQAWLRPVTHSSLVTWV